jgi:aryl-alcohol dehydrogenase-like predicted oxidoreductase
MRLMRPLKPLLRPFLARGEMDNAVTASRASAMRTDWSKAGLLASLDGSLKRLGTDRVDIFLLHSPPAAILARAEPAEALAEAKDSGRAVRVGIACDDILSLDAALALGAVEALELPWDVLAAIDGTPRAEAIAARGIAVIAREVLKLQPGVAPERAFAKARALPIVTTTLIGSRRLERIRALATQESAA